MYVFVAETEGTTKDYNRVSDSLDAEMRDLSKKVQKFEARVEETMEALQASAATMEAAESSFNDIDDDVNAQSRRIMLLEEECFIQVKRGMRMILKIIHNVPGGEACYHRQQVGRDVKGGRQHCQRLPTLGEYHYE